MNNIAFTRTNNAPHEEIEMTLSPEVEPGLSAALQDAFLLPMLQSERTVLPSGLVRITMTLTTEDAALFRQAVTKACLSIQSPTLN